MDFIMESVNSHPLDGQGTSFAIAAALLLICSITDLKSRRVPNKVVVAGILVSLARLIDDSFPIIVERLVAAAVLATALLGLRVAGSRLSDASGIGMGDVKLSIALALLMGWEALFIVYIGACLAAVVGLTGILFGRMSRHTKLPLVPYLFIGSLVYFAYAIILGTQA